MLFRSAAAADLGMVLQEAQQANQPSTPQTDASAMLGPAADQRFNQNAPVQPQGGMQEQMIQQALQNRNVVQSQGMFR